MLASVGPQAARADNPVDGFNEKLAAEAARDGKKPRGVIPLLQLWRNWDRSQGDKLHGLLEELAADRRLAPHRKVLVQAMLAEARMRLGRSKGARTFGDLGYLTDWRVVGPFDNEGKVGIETETPPEQKRFEAPDLAAEFAGRERPVGWRQYPDISYNGYVSLDAVMRPYQNVCAVAETFVHTDKARPLSLWFASAGANRVYWNGEEVLRDDAYRGPGRDRTVAMVGAHAGHNRLLVKVCVASGAWGFTLRLGDARGGVASGLTAATNTTKALDIPRGHAKLRRPAAPVTPLVGLEKAAEGPRAKAEALADLARFLNYSGADDPAERRAKQLAARAADLNPTAKHLRLAARLAEQRGDVMQFSARASQQAPDDPRVRLLAALVLMGGATPEAALPILDGFPPNSDHWPSAALMRASLLVDQELPSAALALVQQVRARVGDTPSVLRRLADLEHTNGHTDRALALRRLVLKQRHDDSGARRVLITDALQRGATAEALEHLEATTSVSPGSVGSLLYVAGVYEALGRDDMVLATYRAALRIVPESAPIHVAYGRALLRADQPGLASKALGAALALAPQDADTRELLEQIKPRKRADEAYARASNEILASRRDSQGYPTTVLQDLTVKRVFDSGLGSTFRQRAVQVHDKEGARNQRTFSIQYDPDTQRVDLRLARVYRKSGGVLESVQSYEQQLGEPWYRIYYDTRAMVVVFPDLEPGDVAEIRYRIDDVAHRNLFADYFGDLHAWQGFAPILRSEYVLITPASRRFYKNEPQLAHLAHTSEVAGDNRIDRYVATDIPAIVPEAGMPGITEISPYLHVSTYGTWNEVGQWYWGLIKDQLYADASLKDKVAEVLQGATTNRQKVERIHNWVVANTRYVGLEFGIHGFLPYRVPLVVQRGFGDCKDKASLMYTMFREAGIDARIVLVRTRRNGAIADFPASLSVFDHAIAYVPEFDLYLDGTAEHSGTRELPTQDQGVTVLVVGPESAQLRRTPVTPASNNRRSRTLQVQLSEDGSARVEGTEQIHGVEAAGYRDYYQAPGTRAERFERALGSLYPGVELTTQSFGGLDDLEQAIEYSYDINVPQLAQWDGDRLRLPPTVLHDLVRSMARTPSRRHVLDLDGNQSYVEERTVRLPRGMGSVELPPGGEAASAFGKLRLDFEQKPGEVTARTEFSVIRDRVDPADYEAFRTWVEQADRLLRQRIGIRKGEP